MTPDDWWRIGARLLGAYFVVLGGLYAAGAVAAFGLGLPEGSSRLVYASMPVLQGLIAGGAGLLLIHRSGLSPAGVRSSAAAAGNAFVPALQLLGVFFLVNGAAELVRVLIDNYFTGADWQIRGSQVASGLVDVVAGVLLTVAPNLVAGKLAQFAERAASKRRPTSGAGTAE